MDITYGGRDSNGPIPLKTVPKNPPILTIRNQMMNTVSPIGRIAIMPIKNVDFVVLFI
jgi:hypothetical protein